MPSLEREEDMKTQLVRVLALVGVAAGFNAGCAAQAQVSGSAEAEAPVVFVGTPTLVAVDSGVWVVSDADYATYYVDDYYWVYRDGRWYRSRDYGGGWVLIEVSVVPVTIVSRNPTLYVHFHGDATARTRSAPRGGEGFASEERRESDERHEGNPHGGPPGHDRDEMPGVGNHRKAEGDQPGNAHGDSPGAGNQHHGGDSSSGDAAKDDKKEEKKDNKKDAKKKK
jgi:hypothetical protein